MAKVKSSKLKAAPKASPIRKRKRVDTADSKPPAKKVKATPREKTSPRKTRGVKQETLECDICAESRPIYRDFPSLPTCSHDATVCTSCYENHFVTRINEDRGQGWSACTCPLCGESVEAKDAQSILPRQISKELGEMIKNVEQQTAQNWIWCPGPGCGRGQLLANKKPKVVCKHCGFEICSKHQIKWHQGMTCREFDEAGDHDTDIAKSVQEIQRTTKPCPHCKRRIKKEGGCNHMNCTGCHKLWLWDSVAFDGEHVPTTAEVRGGSEGHQALDDEARQAVEQVMQFENAHVDNPFAENDRALAENQERFNEDLFQHGFMVAATQATRQQLAEGTEFVPQPNRTPRSAIADPRRRQRQAQRTGDNTNRARSFDGLTDHQRHILPVPRTSNIRSTQTDRPRVRRRPAGPESERPRPNSTRHEIILIEDSSDPSSSDSNSDSDSSSSVDSDGGANRTAQRRGQASRSRPGTGVEVIDLTAELIVIDLTGED